MNLLIYCAGGFGKEICDLAEKSRKWSNIEFVDDGKEEKSFYDKKVNRFEEIAQRFPKSQVEFVIANGEPFIRELLFKKVKSHGYSLASIIDDTTVISTTAIIKEGCVICSHCFVSSDAVLNENCVLQPKSSIGHDSTVGCNTIISSFVCVAGKCNIGANVYIGLSTPIKEGIKIGEGSIIGMGSSVVRDIGDNMVALGNPAREMRKNESKRVFKTSI